jgi:tripartite-type tricarboxylate transporter receptor subunit TctC
MRHRRPVFDNRHRNGGTMPDNKIITIAAALAALTAPAAAQDWPARPLTMVVPTAAGGGTDIIGRILVPRLSDLLGQPIIVENVGASTLAANRVAHARPDGYHFALGTAATHAYSQTLYKAPLYNAADDFEPVVLIAMQPLLLVTRKDFPADDLRGFAAQARTNGEKMRYGSGAGIGSANHLVCELLNAAMGVSVSHVPYRDIGTTTQDMIAGRIDYQCPLPGSMIPLIEANQVKAIAMLGKERLPNLPNLATAQEQGLADFEGTTWDAFFLPKGTPAPIVQKLHDAAIGTMNTSSVRDRLLAIGATTVAPERQSPEYLKTFVATEIGKWAGPITASGARLD